MSETLVARQPVASKFRAALRGRRARARPSLLGQFRLIDVTGEIAESNSLRAQSLGRGRYGLDEGR